MSESDFHLVVPLNGAKPAGGEIFDQGPRKPGRPRKKAPGVAAGTRNEHDAYDTPQECADACAAWLKDHGVGWDPGVSGFDGVTPLAPPLILDPTSGAGPFVVAARKVWPASRVVAVDVRDVCKASCEAAGAIFACTDARTLEEATIGRADLILTNPPFKLADELARHLWAYMKDGASLAFLLPVTFIASKERWVPEGDPKDPPGLFTIAPLSYMAPIVPRPAFTGTSPKFEAALFVWVKGRELDHGFRTLIPRGPIRWVPARKPRGKRGQP